ncbi:MAG: DUF1254 domain-containing protein [Thermodesulfobacteriales bacterium]|nr:MAG: DUF1254 domain-containing protein [Thermodesulfobacteriales bacterium]
MKVLRFSILIFTALIILGVSARLSSAETTNPLEPDVIAQEAYIYFYPLVLMDVTRKQMTNFEKWDGKGIDAPMNTFGNFRAFPPLDFKTVVRPNFDTMYTSLWMDLTNEPMILTIPDSGGRYYLMPSLDMWTDVFAVPGWRTTGTKEGNFAYAPPGWKGELPEGVTRVDAPTPYIWFIGRTKTEGEKDYDAVHKFQDGMKITPLSQWGKDWTAPAGKVDPSIDMKIPPMDQVNNMSGKEFFEYATQLMKLHSPQATDFSQVARLKHVGIVPGEDLDFDKLDPAIQKALNSAPSTGMKQMQDHTAKVGSVENGWQMLISTMGVYGIDYLQRATVALIGLGANQLDDAIYPLLLTDADGNTMSGESQYVLHFDKDELPPAEAFWSVTLYDMEGFAVPNPLNRANLSSWMPLTYNADGSLDLYVQAESPGKDKEANWLPSPKDKPWNLTMRLYAPKPSALDGTWSPTALKRVN